MCKKLIEGPVTPGPEIRDVDEGLKIFSWKWDLVKPYGKIALPDNIQLLGHIPVDKMIDRTKKIRDPLLNLIEGWDQNHYTAATWTAEALTKMFEKFHYANPIDFVETYFEITALCDQYTLDEHSYMAGSNLTPITATIKNMKSTPGYPKFLAYETEEDYLNECGWKEYIDLWNDPETLNNRPIWWCFLKNEVLKISKVTSNDIRMILCTDPGFTRFGAVFEQDQNNRMKEKTETHKAQVGWTPFFGGIDRRIRRISKISNPQFVELDWTRFDGTIPKQLFWRIKQMRFFLLKDQYKTKQNRQKYNWYVKNLLEKIILLPTGEVCQVKKGNPSGQYSTTVDNNFVNVWLTCFEITYMYYKQKGILPALCDLKANIDFICYGDDRLLAVSEDFVKYDPELVCRMYKDIFGMWVKTENIRVSDSVEGLSFCGMKIIKGPRGYVGVPNVDKILTTLSDPVKRLPDIEALWGKLVSLRILCNNCDTAVVDYLDKQIEIVRDYADSEKIELPEVGPNFYDKIW